MSEKSINSVVMKYVHMAYIEIHFTSSRSDFCIQCNVNHSCTVASKRMPIKFFGTFVTKKCGKRLICGQTILMKFNFCIRFLLSVMIQGLKLTLESGNCQLKCFLDAVCVNQYQIVATFVGESGPYQ